MPSDVEVSGIVSPEELRPLLPMSAPLAISTGSWKRLSGVRFSWTMTTMCWIFPGSGKLPQPFKLSTRTLAKTSNADGHMGASIHRE